MKAHRTAVTTRARARKRNHRPQRPQDPWVTLDSWAPQSQDSPGSLGPEDHALDPWVPEHQGSERSSDLPNGHSP